MQTLIKIKRRFYFRHDRAKPGYAISTKRVEDFVKASEFLDVKIEIGTGRHGIPSQCLSCRRGPRDRAYAALLEGRYREAQTIATDADTPLRLSITGTAGYVAKPKDARREALQYNVSVFEDGDYPLDEANRNWGTNFRSPLSAARYVLQVDGEYAGLDVVDEVYERRGKRTFTRVLIGHSSGCLHDDIRERAPELAHLIPWHMSDMQPGSPSQMREIEAKRASIGAMAMLGRDPHESIEDLLARANLLDGSPDGPIYVLGRGWIDAATYRYGSGWVALILPDAALAFVLQLHQEDMDRSEAA